MSAPAPRLYKHRGPRPAPVEDRFWVKVEKTDGCWLWTACRIPDGYGLFWDGTYRLNRSPRFVLAHRFAYEAAVGPIPNGLEMDHLCRNRLCVRPDHLEPVTRSTNQKRSPLTGQGNRKKGTCPKGHLYDAANTRLDKHGGRSCRACDRETARRKRALKSGRAA